MKHFFLLICACVLGLSLSAQQLVSANKIGTRTSAQLTADLGFAEITSSTGYGEDHIFLRSSAEGAYDPMCASTPGFSILCVASF